MVSVCLHFIQIVQLNRKPLHVSQQFLHPGSIDTFLSWGNVVSPNDQITIIISAMYTNPFNITTRKLVCLFLMTIKMCHMKFELTST